MAKSGRVRVIRRVVSAALLGVVLYWVARTEGVAELPSRLARLEPRFVALAVLLPFVAVAMTQVSRITIRARSRAGSTARTRSSTC